MRPWRFSLFLVSHARAKSSQAKPRDHGVTHLFVANVSGINRCPTTP